MSDDNKSKTSARKIFDLFKDYFLHSDEKLVAWLLLIGVVLCIIAIVGLMAVFAWWSAAFWVVMTAKALIPISISIGEFFAILTGIVAVGVLKNYLMGKLAICWRNWLTKKTINELFESANNYLDLHRFSTISDTRVRGNVMSKSHLINANIHRAKEGARVLEDIARFILRDELLFTNIRTLRHALRSAAPIYNVVDDLGGNQLTEKNVRSDISSLVQANSLRIQEALRVLEELSDSESEKQRMKELRYDAYAIHSSIYFAAKKYSRLDTLKGLYLIIDSHVIQKPLDQVIEVINQSAVNVVQYRNKFDSKRAIYENADMIRKRLSSDKLLIINDHIDVALDVADGVHIGQGDYPMEYVRNILPEDYILGVTCHNYQEAIYAAQFNVSYIAIDCLFPISLEELQRVCDDIPKPICAIGGVSLDNLDQVLSAKVSMVALISDVWQTEDPLQSITLMHEKIIANGNHLF